MQGTERHRRKAAPFNKLRIEPHGEPYAQVAVYVPGCRKGKERKKTTEATVHLSGDRGTVFCRTLLMSIKSIPAGE